MRQLVCHPDCSASPITKIEADITATSVGCQARFLLSGDITAIKVPPKRRPSREDLLWQTTCAEIFWQPIGDSFYREFNLSPSRQWAAYDFVKFRSWLRNSPVDYMKIECQTGPDTLLLSADIASELAVPAKIALNMIVEDAHGTLTNWALAFDDGPYEFHSETCRTIHLENRP